MRQSQFQHNRLSDTYALKPDETEPVFSYKLRYIVGFGLAEMAISIYRNMNEYTDREAGADNKIITKQQQMEPNV